MINLWTKFDDFWLRRGDQLVLWLWNELGVPWRKFVRGFCLAWLATQVVIEVQWIDGWRLGVFIWPLVYLVIWAYDEVIIATNPAEAIYVRYQQFRAMILTRTVRFLFWFVFPITDLNSHYVAADEVRDALFLVFLYLINSLPPLHPREKKRKPVAVLRPQTVLSSN